MIGMKAGYRKFRKDDNGLIIMREGVQAEGLMSLIDDIPFTGMTMLEIGCYSGESTIMFAESGKMDKIYVVDLWHGNNAIAEDVFDKRMEGYDVVKVKGNINTALKHLPPVDFAYIDGSHTYSAVKNDIIKVMTIMKEGGMVSGHDYCDQYKDRVVMAVNEVLGEPDRVYADSSWVKYL